MDELPKLKVGDVVRIEADGQYVSVGDRSIRIEEPVDDLFRITSMAVDYVGIERVTVDTPESAAARFLRALAEKLRYVPGTYGIYDDDIDECLLIARFLEGDVS